MREIHAAQIPLISAIGHEIDVTLTDLVADVRGGMYGMLRSPEPARRATPVEAELEGAEIQG